MAKNISKAVADFAALAAEHNTYNLDYDDYVQIFELSNQNCLKRSEESAESFIIELTMNSYEAGFAAGYKAGKRVKDHE